MNTIETILASVISSATVVGLFIFILKNYFLNELNKDLENHKYALQREVLKAQLVGSHSAEIYKKMYELIEISYGVVTKSLHPLQIVPDWATVGPDDVENYLIERKASVDSTVKIKEAFLQRESNRVELLNKVIKLLDSHDLSRKYQDAKNFVIANSLFIDQEVENKAHEILNRIHEGCIAFEMWAQYDDRESINKEFAKNKEIRQAIDDLKVSIKLVLMPVS